MEMRLKDVLTNIKNWDFDVRSYPLTKAEADAVKKVGELLKQLDMRVDLKEIINGINGDTQKAYVIPSIPFGSTNEEALRTIYPAMNVVNCDDGEHSILYLNSNHNDAPSMCVPNPWLYGKYTRPNFSLFLQRWAKGETNV